jgi:uncharacterized repeat protein (TIGR02543 family)
MKKAIIVLLTVLALIGCDTDGGGDSGTAYARGLWGEWLRMDTGDKWYITNNTIKINGANTSITASLSNQSERVIEVTDGGRRYYLYASRIANASFTGTIAGAGTARAIGGGLGGVKVSIANLANKSNEVSAVTDAEGTFTAKGVIPGDTYKVTPEGGTSAMVTPASDGADVGVVTVTSGVNFKTSIYPSLSSTDMTEMYMNESYAFNLEFENVGDEDCPAPSYAINAPSGVSITGNTQGILGTIEPGDKKSVSISVRCTAITNDHEYKNIRITIMDGTGKTWEDSVSLRFYKEATGFNVKAEKPISGVVISPDAKIYSFTNTINGTIFLPRRTDGDYLVVFSGATLTNETRYALGVGIDADGDFSSLLNTGVYERNDTEGTAFPIKEQKIMAYLYKNDIDYYRVSYSNVRFPAVTPIKITITYNANGGTGTVLTSQTVNSGASIPLASGSGLIKAGYTFGGWNTNAAGTGTSYTAGASYGFTANTTLYAEWTVATLPSNYTLTESLAWISDNAVESRDYTITLKSNETIAPQTLSYGGKNVSITLNGGSTERTVSLSSDGSLFTVDNGVTLTLDANVTLQGRSDNTLSLVWVDSGGTLVLKDRAKITSNTTSAYGGGVAVAGGGTFTMSGGEISDNTSGAGGGVYVSGTFTMSGGTISDNIAYYGGGIYFVDGMFTMSEGTISDNIAYYGGGGVDVSNKTFTMSGGTINGNTVSDGGGGGVDIYSGTLMMSGGTISGNTASKWGGGVYVYNGTFTKQSGGTIYGSNASGSLKNAATDGNGHAAYVATSPAKKRNTTAGSGITLNSGVSGSAGGWE